MKQPPRELIWQAKKCSDLDNGTRRCLSGGDGDYSSIAVFYVLIISAAGDYSDSVTDISCDISLE